MTQLLIATRNLGKLTEFKQLISDTGFEIVSLNDIGIDPLFDVEETGETFADNASLKAKGFSQKSKLLALADDSGLAVDALGGRPGVYSRRYGPTDEARNLKLLEELKDIPVEKRVARFVCVMALYNPSTDSIQTVEGRVEGRISEEIRGNQGFGYDPVFIPDEGNGRTFAELGTDFKNTVSHRARALQKIKILLRQS